MPDHVIRVQKSNGSYENVFRVPERDWDGLGQLMSGAMTQDLLKALEAGTGLDAEAFTGGRAMQYESLQDTLLSTTLTEEDALLWRRMPKRSVRATVDQFTRKTGFGGRFGLATAESSNPTSHMSELARVFALVKYYRDYREVSDVSMMVNMVESPMVTEEQSGMLNIIHALNEDMYWGDTDVFPLRVNGLFNALTTEDAGAVVVDMHGKTLTSRDPFEDAMALVRNQGGRITHAFMTPLMCGDLSKVYSSAERVTLTASTGGALRGGVNLGGLDTFFGPVDFEGDPFCFTGWACPSAAEGDATKRPGASAGVAAAAAGSGADADNLPTGGYWYRVCSVNEEGRSVSAAISGAVTVSGGENVTLTIQPPASGPDPSGYEVYRSAKDAANADDCRFLWRGKAAASGNTSFVDAGEWVPGATHMALIDLRPTASTVQWSQLLPASKKKLAETGPTQPFLCNLYGAFRIAKPEWLGLLRNFITVYDHDNGWAPV